jgi:hypothetical protein
MSGVGAAMGAGVDRGAATGGCVDGLALTVGGISWSLEHAVASTTTEVTTARHVRATLAIIRRV